MQILNVFHSETKMSHWYHQLNFWMAFPLLVVVLGEIVYFFMVSLLGLRIEEEKSEKEIEKENNDIEKGEQPKKEKEKEEKKTNKDKKDDEIIKTPTQNDKKPEERHTKRSFFLKKDDFVSRITKSLIKMSSLRTSKDPETQAKYLLFHNNLCSEIDGAYMYKTYYGSMPARLYMIFSMLRCLGLVLSLLLLNYHRVYQSIVLGVLTLPCLATIIIAAPHLKYKPFSIA